MTTHEVAIAAIALRRFTLPQLAAFCGLEPTEVRNALENFDNLVLRTDPLGPDDEIEAAGTVPEEWMVSDAAALRARVRETPAELGIQRSAPEPLIEENVKELRLRRAEETLLDCAEEESAQARQVLATTAESYLRQYLAEAQDEPNWWTVALPTPGTVSADPGAATDSQRVTISVALASMTKSEARGREVSGTYLIEIATEISNFVNAVDRPVFGIVERFFDLATDLSHSALEADAGNEAAPDQLLSALSWRRLRAEIHPDVARASERALELLQWIDGGDEEPSGLFQHLGRLPDGRNRIAVYADLLSIVPQQFAFETEREIVPGALVSALADSTAVEHLEGAASYLSDELVRAPFRSDSALIGMVAAQFEDLAAQGADMDTGILSRSERTKEKLLSLADVPVRHPADPAWLETPYAIDD